MKTKQLERPDLLDENSPSGLRVVQLGADPERPCSHVYMEAQVFAPDSQRFLFHRAAHAHGPLPGAADHQYILCDLGNGAAMIPVTDEPNTVAPSFAPDGSWIFYFVDNSRPNAGSIVLKRVRPDGTERETLVVVDAPIPGAALQPSQVYPLSTIRSDGRRLATRMFLGDGRGENMPSGLVVFDLVRGSAQVVLQGCEYNNLHPQYSRSLDPEHCRDLLVQHGHGLACDAAGRAVRLAGGQGVDIHVVRDDGTNFRTLPWGRDGREFCQGHQCWRGRSEWAITSTTTFFPDRGHAEREEAQLIEGLPTDSSGHNGRGTPGGLRNDLTRAFPNPMFFHFATDLAGNRMISDYRVLAGEQTHLYLMDLGTPGREPARNIRYLLNTRTTSFMSGKEQHGPLRFKGKDAHAHPFLSPDSRRAFFNSDESGVLQAYMIEGMQSL